MAFAAYLLRRYPVHCGWLLLGVVLAATLQVAALLLLAHGAEQAYAGTTPFRAFGIVLACLLIQGAVWQGTILYARRLIVRVVEAIGQGIAGRLPLVPLETIESLGRQSIQARLTVDLRSLPEVAMALLSALAVAALGVCVAIYMAFVAPVVLAILMLVAMTVHRRYGRWRAAATGASVGEERGGAAVADSGVLLRRLYDLRLLAAGGREATAACLTWLAERVPQQASASPIAAPLVDFWLLLGLGWVVLLLPDIGIAENVVAILAVSFFLWAQLRAVAATLPVLERGDGAIERLTHLETRLEEAARPPVRYPLVELRALRFEGVTYAHADGDGRSLFELGPIDLTLAPGEILLVVGCGGSGKTTLMRLLAGLYRPRTGAALLNGRLVPAAAYRSLCAVALAPRADDPDDTDDAILDRALDLLRRLGLPEQAPLLDQRLLRGARGAALLAALASDRPLLLLDGWGAHMDARGRDWFVRELLPALKRRGKCIVLTTDDVRLASHADRCLQLRQGGIARLDEEGR